MMWPCCSRLALLPTSCAAVGAAVTARKTIFSFFKSSEKMVFPKYRTGMWYFSYYQEGWYFFFPKIWFYLLHGKLKIIFFRYIHGNITFSSNDLKRWCFQKKMHWNMIFLVLSGKIVFFSPKSIFFLWTENKRWSFSRNT